MEGTSSRNNMVEGNNGRNLYSIMPGRKGILVRDATTFQPIENVIQPSGSNTKKNAKYFLMEGEREANIIYKDGKKYKQNRSQFTGKD